MKEQEPERKPSGDKRMEELTMYNEERINRLREDAANEQKSSGKVG